MNLAKLGLTEVTENFYIGADIDTGDKKHKLVVEVIDMFEATGDNRFIDKPFLCVISSIVSMDDLNIDKKKDIAKTSCVDLADVNEYDIYSYGCNAKLSESELSENDNFESWLSEQLPIVSMFYGFCMDKCQNRVGATGWDFVEGNI